MDDGPFKPWHRQSLILIHMGGNRSHSLELPPSSPRHQRFARFSATENGDMLFAGKGKRRAISRLIDRLFERHEQIAGLKESVSNISENSVFEFVPSISQ